MRTVAPEIEAIEQPVQFLNGQIKVLNRSGSGA
jgi:hypothetical protein